MKQFILKETTSFREDDCILKVGRNTAYILEKIEIPSEKFIGEMGEKFNAYSDDDIDIKTIQKTFRGEHPKYTVYPYNKSYAVIDKNTNEKIATLKVVERAEYNIKNALIRKKWGYKKPSIIDFKDGVLTISNGFEGQVIGYKGRVIKTLEKVYGGKITVKGV